LAAALGNFVKHKTPKGGEILPNPGLAKPAADRPPKGGERIDERFHNLRPSLPHFLRKRSTVTCEVSLRHILSLCEVCEPIGFLAPVNITLDAHPKGEL